MAAENSAGYERRREARRAESRTVAAPRRWRRVLVWGVAGLVLVVLIALAAWLWHAASRVHAVGGRVQAAVAKVAPLADARLVEICVREGERVEKDQVLARVDDRDLRVALAVADAEVAMQRSRHEEAVVSAALVETALHAEFEDIRAQVRVAEARVASARNELTWREKELAEEVKRAAARCLESRATLERLRRGARNEDVQTAQVRLEAAEALLALRELEERQSRELVAEGIDSQHLLEVRRTQAATQRGAVREAELALARLLAGTLPEELAEAAQALAAREADLALARTAVDGLISLQAGVTVREAELARELGRLAQAEARQGEVRMAQARMRVAAAELARAAATAAGRQAAVDGQELLSPVGGIVTRVFPEVGDLCRQGEPIVLVADARRQRWIEAFVSEEDAVRVHPGQAAWVQVPAFVGPYLPAVVEQVGLQTQALEPDAVPAASGATTNERVWVKIGTREPLPERPVPGTSVRAVIRVR